MRVHSALARGLREHDLAVLREEGARARARSARRPRVVGIRPHAARRPPRSRARRARAPAGAAPRARARAARARRAPGRRRAPASARAPPRRARASGSHQALPLVDQARVDALEHGAEVRDHVVHGLGLRGLGHRLHERVVDLRDVAQQQALDALQAVEAHVVVEAVVALEHLARDRLRVHVLVAHPRVASREELEGLLDERAARRERLHLVEPADALLVGHALGLQLREQLALDPVELLEQDRARILEHRLDQRQHLVRERLVGRLEVRERLDHVERERLVQREVPLQVVGDAHAPPARRADRARRARCRPRAGRGTAARPRAAGAACARSLSWLRPISSATCAPAAARIGIVLGLAQQQRRASRG